MFASLVAEEDSCSGVMEKVLQKGGKVVEAAEEVLRREVKCRAMIKRLYLLKQALRADKRWMEATGSDKNWYDGAHNAGFSVDQSALIDGYARGELDGRGDGDASGMQLVVDELAKLAMTSRGMTLASRCTFGQGRYVED